LSNGKSGISLFLSKDMLASFLCQLPSGVAGLKKEVQALHHYTSIDGMSTIILMQT